MTRRRTFLAASLALLLLPLAAAVAFERSVLTIRTAGGERHRFDVELAITPQERAQGLMFRETLAADAGMLFVYEAEQPVTMWMKNTLLTLDMLFIDRDGTIVSIAARTTPGSLDIIPSGQPVKAVLELNGGASEALGLAPGDRVLHPLLLP